MPEGQENDRLDGEELENWVIGLEEVPGGEVEEEETVERQGYRDVVDDGDVKVPSIRTVKKCTNTPIMTITPLHITVNAKFITCRKYCNNISLICINYVR